MELSANELRIGNYVSFYANDKVFKIEGINSHSENAWRIGYVSHENQKTAIDCLKPIQITEEWLIDLGFIKVSGWDDYVGWKKGEVEIEEIEPNKKYNNYLDLEINYVHELQNLYFALTKQELILK